MSTPVHSLALVTGIQHIDKPTVWYQLVTLMVLGAFQAEQRVRPIVPLSPKQDIFEQRIGCSGQIALIVFQTYFAGTATRLLRIPLVGE
jgi:hypothetical protein